MGRGGYTAEPPSAGSSQDLMAERKLGPQEVSPEGRVEEKTQMRPLQGCGQAWRLRAQTLDQALTST